MASIRSLARLVLLSDEKNTPLPSCVSRSLPVPSCSPPCSPPLSSPSPSCDPSHEVSFLYFPSPGRSRSPPSSRPSSFPSSCSPSSSSASFPSSPDFFTSCPGSPSISSYRTHSFHPAVSRPSYTSAFPSLRALSFPSASSISVNSPPHVPGPAVSFRSMRVPPLHIVPANSPTSEAVHSPSFLFSPFSSRSSSSSSIKRVRPPHSNNLLEYPPAFSCAVCLLIEGRTRSRRPPTFSGALASSRLQAFRKDRPSGRSRCIYITTSYRGPPPSFVVPSASVTRQFSLPHHLTSSFFSSGRCTASTASVSLSAPILRSLAGSTASYMSEGEARQERQEKKKKTRKCLLIGLLRRPERVVQTDAEVLLKMVGDVQEKRQGRAASQLLNVLAPWSPSPPRMLIHALSNLQQKKWLPSVSPDLVEKRNQRILLSLQLQASSPFLGGNQVFQLRSAKRDGADSLHALGDAQRVIVKSLGALSPADFCLAFRLLTSSSFSLSPVEWGLLVTQLKIRIPRLDVAGLCQVALALAQTLPCSKSKTRDASPVVNGGTREGRALQSSFSKQVDSHAEGVPGEDATEGEENREAFCPEEGVSRMPSLQEPPGFEQNLAEGKKGKIISESSRSLCGGRLEADLVAEILRQVFPPVQKEVHRNSVPLLPVDGEGGADPTTRRTGTRRHVNAEEVDTETTRLGKGEPSSCHGATTAVFDASGGGVCTPALPPRSLLIGACGRLVDLSVPQRVQLKEVLRQVVMNARDQEDVEGTDQSLRGGETTVPEGESRPTRDHKEEEKNILRRRGRRRPMALNVQDHVRKRDETGEESENEPDDQEEAVAQLEGGLEARKEIEAVVFSSPPPRTSSASKEIARVISELLHVPTAMSALQSSDVFLFLDCLDGVYRHLTHFTDAQLAAFSRRVSLVLFEKRTADVDNNTKEHTEIIDGFQLFALFLLDRLPSMPLVKRQVLRALLISLLQNHPRGLQPTLSILAASFLIDLHPLLIKQTDNLWSGVDALSPRYASFSKYSLSEKEFCSWILDASRIFHLSLSNSQSTPGHETMTFFSGSKRRRGLSSSPCSSPSLSSSLQSCVAGKNVDSKLHAAWRVFSRSVCRAVQVKLHELDTLDLAKLAEAAVLLRRIGGGREGSSGRKRSADVFFLLMRAGRRGGGGGLEEDAERDRETEIKIDEEEREMLDLLGQIFRAMDQRSWTLSLEHAGHLLTVLSLLSSSCEDKRRKGGVKDLCCAKGPPFPPSASRRTASPQLIGLLARLLHLAITQKESPAVRHAESPRRGGSAREKEATGEDVGVHRTPGRGVPATSYPRRPPSFAEFLLHQEDRKDGDTIQQRGVRRELLQGRQVEEERETHGEDEEEEDEQALLDSTSVKQLKIAMSVFLPRTLATLRTARLPEDVCSLLLFSLESIVWCLQEVSDVGSMGWSSHVGCASAPRAFIPANIEEEQHGNSAVSSSSSSPVAQGISNQLRAASGRPDQQNAMLSDASSVDPREKGEGGREEDDLLEEVGDAAGQRRRRREDDDEEEKRRRKGREQVLLTLFGITKQSLAGVFGACGLLLNEMSPKDRRRTRVVGLTSRLARYLPADIALSTERQLLNEDLLRALPADVEALRSQCVEVISMRAVKRQKVLMERGLRRQEKRRQQEEERKALGTE